MRVCAARASSQKPASALCASSAAISCSTVGKSKSHPESVQPLPDTLEVDRFVGHGHAVRSPYRRNKASDDGPQAARMGEYRRAGRSGADPSTLRHDWRTSPRPRALLVGPWWGGGRCLPAPPESPWAGNCVAGPGRHFFLAGFQRPTTNPHPSDVILTVGGISPLRTRNPALLPGRHRGPSPSSCHLWADRLTADAVPVRVQMLRVGR